MSIDMASDRVHYADAMLIRSYADGDAGPTLDLFRRAIDVTARSHYSAEQVRAWLGDPPALDQWDGDRRRVRTYVAEHDGALAGFTDLDQQGYVDRLFVSPETGRRGVGRQLLQHVVAIAEAEGLPELTTHASLVARPVFEREGFTVVHRETVHRGDVSLDRFLMRRTASRPTAAGGG
jgi:putative acetyltransferase